MKVETIAKLAPLTATKCVSPDLRISFLKVDSAARYPPAPFPGSTLRYHRFRLQDVIRHGSVDREI